MPVTSATFRVLSHPLTADAPVWPGNPPAARVQLVESIARGDVDNAAALSLFSHSGTHVDTPWHFNPDGPAADQLPISAFIFSAPRLVDIPKPEGGFITVSDLAARAEALDGADIVLLRTGWGSLRAEDPERYPLEGPLLHPDAAQLLMDRHGSVRAIATDAVSIGSPQDRAASVRTHRILTGVGRDDGRFILIYEDVLLEPDLPAPARVYAWPLMVPGSDGSPCTIVAELVE
ncbi:MAG TPA: cyclase family protein [Egibacteraceae bacterium]|nr:cyclase family protein [Egibacteraceae bacterium]